LASNRDVDGSRRTSCTSASSSNSSAATAA
jgi:hypothetical protein